MSEKIPQILDKYSTVGLSFTLLDSAGNPVPSGALSSVRYSIVTAAGIVVNGRDMVSVAAVNPVVIKLDPEDTAIDAESLSQRIVRLFFMIRFVYHDDLLGDATEKVKEYELQVSEVKKK